MKLLYSTICTNMEMHYIILHPNNTILIEGKFNTFIEIRP